MNFFRGTIDHSLGRGVCKPPNFLVIVQTKIPEFSCVAKLRNIQKKLTEYRFATVEPGVGNTPIELLLKRTLR